MTDRPQRQGDVAGEGADVGAFGDGGGESGFIFAGGQEAQRVDCYVPRLQDYVPASTGQIVGAFAVDLKCRKGRRDLFDCT